MSNDDDARAFQSIFNHQISIDTPHRKALNIIPQWPGFLDALQKLSPVDFRIFSEQHKFRSVKNQ